MVTYTHACMWCTVTTVATLEVWSADPRPIGGRTRSALLEAAARWLSATGTQPGAWARGTRGGYTRGALYHLFANKEDLAWRWCVSRRPGTRKSPSARRNADPVGALIAVARGHAVLCRRDVARACDPQRRFSGQDHLVGRRSSESGVGSSRLHQAHHRRAQQRNDPAGAATPRAGVRLSRAIEGLTIQLAGRAPFVVSSPNASSWVCLGCSRASLDRSS